MRAFAFKPIQVDLDRDEAMGWTLAADPGSSDFTVNDVLWGEHLVFCLRHDRIRLPPTLVKIEVSKRLSEWEKKTERKATRNEKMAISEDVRQTLRKKALPRVSTHDVVWAIDQGVVRLWATSATLVTQFEDLFLETFEIQLAQKCPYAEVERMGLPKEVLESICEIEPARLAAP